MKNENLNRNNGKHYSARKLDLLQKIVASLAILDNRYKCGFEFVFMATRGYLWSNIKITGTSYYSIDIMDINSTDAINDLTNYAHDLEAKINE